MARGERIPPTRELAQSIGLNRATITAAFEVLEAEGLIEPARSRSGYRRFSAADIERLTRRLRSVSNRLEGIEDGVDRLSARPGSIRHRSPAFLAQANDCTTQLV